MDLPAAQLEWLETGRFGSFALGCVDRQLRRKYHALLTVREPGRGDAWNVLAEVRETVRRAVMAGATERPDAHGVPLWESSGRDSEATLVGFSPYPHATHRYRALGVTIERRVSLDGDQVVLHYRLEDVEAPLILELAPLLRCRAVHDLTFENPFLDGALHRRGEGEFTIHPYSGMPALSLRVERSDGGRAPELEARGEWLPVSYGWETERGYAAAEDLFCPGRLSLAVEQDAEVRLVVGLLPERTTTRPARTSAPPALRPGAIPAFREKLERAAAQFWMDTRAGVTTVVAGYPWFGPWGRDALIALPGLYLASGDFERVAAVLEGMLAARVQGLIPNIPALGDLPANTCSIDASLLFIRAVQWFSARSPSWVERFMGPVCELLEAIADARDQRMRFDHGVGVWMERGPWALTWMDALVDGQPVTPRAGYAVEIDALAYNAAKFAQRWAEGRRSGFARAFAIRLRTAESDFLRRYWDDARGYLADGHDGQQPDPALRPNQLFALGLPFTPVPGALARSALEAVSRTLLVPAGLRTLAPGHAAYRGAYEGSAVERDLAYHQGTVWPWLLGIYADAVQAVHGRAELESRLSPTFAFFARHLDGEGCMGQVNEVFAGDAPHHFGGTPAQAWSVSELYRALCLTQGIEAR